VSLVCTGDGSHGAHHDPPVVAGGDPAQARFLEFASAELDRAYRLAGLLLADASEAQDATQDALVRAWRSSGSLRDAASFQAWFDRILVNVCRDRLRRERRIRFIALDGIADAAGRTDPFKRVLDADEVVRTIAALDVDLRTVVILRFWADLSVDDIALRLDWPVGTVKSRLHRALARMRTDLEAAGEREVPA
jgi:RNA polymerase sigma-70 factor (ECF subfamily)